MIKLIFLAAKIFRISGRSPIQLEHRHCSTQNYAPTPYSNSHLNNPISYE
ncbi:MAG: hypothetical protein IPL35_10440 [Sphingobacteriales bacterium]|nr:hypothetical protein [Sphingobacteriales bacterium]